MSNFQVYYALVLRKLSPFSKFLQQHRLFSTETKIEKFTENVLLKSLNKYTPGLFIFILNFFINFYLIF